MYKEFIICFLVIVIVLAGNIITQNNTNKIVDEMSNNLNILKEELVKEEKSKEQINLQMQQTREEWEKQYEELAYYIEHDELEKVETELTRLMADIEMEEYSMGIENLENCVFVLEHIKDKSAFKIVNIF